jgi:hypothetical protein
MVDGGDGELEMETCSRPCLISGGSVRAAAPTSSMT